MNLVIKYDIYVGSEQVSYDGTHLDHFMNRVGISMALRTDWTDHFYSVVLF